MPIVTSSYRPKRAPRKERKQPPIANRIVEPGPMKPRKGPVIRLGAEAPAGVPLVSDGIQPKRPAIVEPKRKRTTIFGPVPDLTDEELRQRGDAADALWRELVRRAALSEGE